MMPVINRGKTWAAAAYFVAVALAQVVVPFVDKGERPTAVEWVQVAIAGVTAFVVHMVPLAEGHPWVKTSAGAVLAGLQVLVSVIVGGLTGGDVLMIVFAVAGALGIGYAPATSDNGLSVPAGKDRYDLAG
jgi:hypothetical protein